MNALRVVLIIIAISGSIYGLYCQAKARKCISKEKLKELNDTSILATGPMPPKEILNEEGLRYNQGFRMGVAIFIASLLLLSLLSMIK